MLGFSSSSKTNTDSHHHLSETRLNKQESAVGAVKEILGPMNIFKDDKVKLHHLVTKQALTEDSEASILSVVGRGESAKVAFVQERITGGRNRWDRMTKVKYVNWDTLSKKVSMKGHTKDFQFRSTTNLFSRLLVIAKSGCDLDLQQAISKYEFSNINPVLMKPDGTLHPCVNKNHLIHALEGLVEPEATKESAPSQADADVTSTELGDVQVMPSPVTPTVKCYLIIDGMAVVQTLMNVQTSSTWKDLGETFVADRDSLLGKYLYTGGRVIFDNYDKTLPLKDEIRY